MNCEIARKGIWRKLCSCGTKPPPVALAGALEDEKAQKKQSKKIKNSPLLFPNSCFGQLEPSRGKKETLDWCSCSCWNRNKDFDRSKMLWKEKHRALVSSGISDVGNHRNKRRRGPQRSRAVRLIAPMVTTCAITEREKQEKQPLVEPERWEFAFTAELFPRVSSPFVRGCQQCSVNSGSLVWRKHCRVDVCSRVKEARRQNNVAEQTLSPQTSNLVISAIRRIKWEVDWTR